MPCVMRKTLCSLQPSVEALLPAAPSRLSLPPTEPLDAWLSKRRNFCLCLHSSKAKTNLMDAGILSCVNVQHHDEFFDFFRAYILQESILQPKNAFRLWQAFLAEL
ncbi:MAG: hypothetical protein LBU32_05920 [Clostridiales bacterium]|nr:hypothetical protein [Clostridiales bacterium]